MENNKTGTGRTVRKVEICFPPAMIQRIDALTAEACLLNGRSAFVRRACLDLLDRMENETAQQAR